MIEIHDVTKRYGSTLAVDGLSFEIRDGEVTGFLGPNGAGKSTTMRMVVDLDAPTSGQITIDGRRYQDLRFPLRHVGALLEARAIHPGRSARNHLRWLADSNGIDRRRVDEVLDLVGLSDVAHRRSGEFSLGMGQRLGIATALLGDPEALLLDEPVNGLDPEGIQWIRQLLRSLAAEGTVEDVVQTSSTHHVRVDTAEPETLERLLSGRGGHVDRARDGALVVTGIAARDIGVAAGAAGITLYELAPQHPSLEDAFMALTRDAAEYHAGGDLAAAHRGAAAA